MFYLRENLLKHAGGNYINYVRYIILLCYAVVLRYFTIISTVNNFAAFVAASLIFSEVVCYRFATEISIFFLQVRYLKTLSVAEST
jgi:hypothetical protein